MKIPFRVITAFKATAAVSGEECVFEPGDEVSCVLGQQHEDVVTIEGHNVLYRVKRFDLEERCISNNLGTLFYPGP